jgi:hypothetical protein
VERRTERAPQTGTAAISSSIAPPDFAFACADTANGAANAPHATTMTERTTAAPHRLPLTEDCFQS